MAGEPTPLPITAVVTAATATAAETGTPGTCSGPATLIEPVDGERLLNLNTGADSDILRLARGLGPDGLAYGLQATDATLALAEQDRLLAGVRNVEYLRGTLTAIPLPDGEVDAAVGNAAIDPDLDRPAMLAEVFRVLVPGGQLAFRDVVAETAAPTAVLTRTDYLAALAAAGFTAASIDYTHPVAEDRHAAIIRADKPATPR